MTRVGVLVVVLAESRPWGLAFGLLAVAALLVAVGLALVVRRRGR